MKEKEYMERIILQKNLKFC